MRGLLEALILDTIAREPKHGYALLRELEQVFGAPPNRNQVYPMLNRLEREGYLRADRAEGRGKTRYHLTGQGLELLKDYRVRPALFAKRVQALWGAPAEERSPAQAGPQPAREAGPRFRVAGEPAPAAPAPAPPARAPVPPPAEGCTLEVVLRQRPGQRFVALELHGFDPACPACAPFGEAVRRAAERFP
jgi:DNA-binding PadR family transcriptional regulator